MQQVAQSLGYYIDGLEWEYSTVEGESDVM